MALGPVSISVLADEVEKAIDASQLEPFERITLYR